MKLIMQCDLVNSSAFSRGNRLKFSFCSRKENKKVSRVAMSGENNNVRTWYAGGGQIGSKS